MFNADRVRDLCLPAFEDSPLPAGSGESSGSRKVDGIEPEVCSALHIRGCSLQKGGCSGQRCHLG